MHLGVPVFLYLLPPFVVTCVLAFVMSHGTSAICPPVCMLTTHSVCGAAASGAGACSSLSEQDSLVKIWWSQEQCAEATAAAIYKFFSAIA